ncbi:MAG: beta barrel domain-containing protein [Giesbergeria sp.]
MAKPKVGELLWTHNFNYLSRRENAVILSERITKVTRKYIWLEDRTHVDPETLLEGPVRMGSRVQYWRTREEAFDDLERQQSRSRINYMSPCKHLTGNQLKRICDVLEGKAGWETLSTYV